MELLLRKGSIRMLNTIMLWRHTIRSCHMFGLYMNIIVGYWLFRHNHGCTSIFFLLSLPLVFIGDKLKNAIGVATFHPDARKTIDKNFFIAYLFLEVFKDSLLVEVMVKEPKREDGEERRGEGRQR